VPGNYLRVTREGDEINRSLSRTNFSKAAALMPTDGPGAIKARQGSAYTWAILMDTSGSVARTGEPASCGRRCGAPIWMRPLMPRGGRSTIRCPRGNACNEDPTFEDRRTGYRGEARERIMSSGTRSGPKQGRRGEQNLKAGQYVVSTVDTRATRSNHGLAWRRWKVSPASLSNNSEASCRPCPASHSPCSSNVTARQNG
jgi:hypothetical protein